MFVHEDERRKLIEWGKGDWKVQKVVIAKANCDVGDHHHANKDEHFMLLSGRAQIAVVGDDMRMFVTAPHEWYVPRGTYHRFVLDEGSILLGTASEEFDPADELAGHPGSLLPPGRASA